jgi:mannitol/fructose-specific phosphotransferase system IIA component (Ntr-type)
METHSEMVLADLIQPERMQLNLAAGNRDAVLSELVNLIPSLKDQPSTRETLLKALREREQLHSTGIGDGVALPHARNALVGLVAEPIIVFGRHPQGIGYGAIDGKPTYLFFLLVAPSVTQHLAVLARISRVLRDPGLRSNLIAASTAEAVHRAISTAEARMYDN